MPVVSVKRSVQLEVGIVVAGGIDVDDLLRSPVFRHSGDSEDGKERTNETWRH